MTRLKTQQWYKTDCTFNTLNKNFDFCFYSVRFRFLDLLASFCTSRAANFCCKIKAVLSSCSIHVPYPYPHRARQPMDLYGFSHTLPSVTTRAGMRTRSVSSRTPTLAAATVVPSAILADSDPGRQRSSWASILAGSDPRPLSRYRSLAATFAPGARPSLSWRLTHLSFGIVCTLADLTLFRRSRLLSNPLVYLVVRWVKVFVG